MSKQHQYRASISSVPKNTLQPLWSVMIPTYNCANYLRETLSSVLAQDPGADVMQIEVVDDHSTKDDPEAVVRELAGNRVSFYRQPQNVGHTKNFNTCLQRSRGKLIHILHGDDCVRQWFYVKMQQAFNDKPEVGAAFCRHIFINEQSHWQFISELLQPKSGLLNNWLEDIIVKQYIQTPSIVVRREVYESLGGFDSRFKFYYEDWEMWVRIATQYAVWYEVEPLAAYRLRSASNSGHSIRTGENMQDVRKGIEIVQSYLPNYLSHAIVNKLLNQNREHSALCALNTAQQMLSIGDVETVTNQIQEALKCSHSFTIIKLAVKLFLKKTVRQILKPVNTLIES
ncbi:family 2 glycosyl transferase [Nostoc commune NIES-4072]|uniref:Family 2 glycosyl transferase n=1 Tax=Nostoc commune NIES-4072 TaxID=2005467 RepID=A0A2R5FM16_NOSCO|nr:glycosyltransferase [Nostoc commune]BBD69180.1 family 2 glycosyl transferase [Nostoc commune HK-02]GBG19822.1 family 2 glycosyl transferase [Nostoc commune NIES-4072]